MAGVDDGIGDLTRLRVSHLVGPHHRKAKIHCQAEHFLDGAGIGRNQNGSVKQTPPIGVDFYQALVSDAVQEAERVARRPRDVIADVTRRAGASRN